MKQLSAVLAAALLLLALAVPVYAHEDPPEGGLMYEGYLTVLPTINGKIGTPSNVFCRVNINNDPNWFDHDMTLYFLLDGEKYEIYCSESSGHIVGSGDADLLNYSHHGYPGWVEKQATTISLARAIKEKSVTGTVYNKAGNLQLDILASDLQELYAPEFTVYQSKDGKVRYSFFADDAYLSIRDDKSEQHDYHLRHTSFSVQGAEPEGRQLMVYHPVVYQNREYTSTTTYATAAYRTGSDSMRLCWSLNGKSQEYELFPIHPDRPFPSTEAIAQLEQAAVDDPDNKTITLRADNITAYRQETNADILEYARARDMQVKICFDTVFDSRIQSRMSINASSVQRDIDPQIYLGSKTIANDLLRRYANNIKVFSIDRNITAPVALSILPESPISNPSIYQYNRQNGAATLLLAHAKVDAKGYVQFAVPAGGDYFISDGILDT